MGNSAPNHKIKIRCRSPSRKPQLSDSQQPKPKSLAVESVIKQVSHNHDSEIETTLNFISEAASYFLNTCDTHLLLNICADLSSYQKRKVSPIDLSKVQPYFPIEQQTIYNLGPEVQPISTSSFEMQQEFIEKWSSMANPKPGQLGPQPRDVTSNFQKEKKLNFYNIDPLSSDAKDSNKKHVLQRIFSSNSANSYPKTIVQNECKEESQKQDFKPNTFSNIPGISIPHFQQNSIAQIQDYNLQTQTVQFQPENISKNYSQQQQGVNHTQIWSPFHKTQSPHSQTNQLINQNNFKINQSNPTQHPFEAKNISVNEKKPLLTEGHIPYIDGVSQLADAKSPLVNGISPFVDIKSAFDNKKKFNGNQRPLVDSRNRLNNQKGAFQMNINNSYENDKQWIEGDNRVEIKTQQNLQQNSDVQTKKGGSDEVQQENDYQQTDILAFQANLNNTSEKENLYDIPGFKISQEEKDNLFLSFKREQLELKFIKPTKVSLRNLKNQGYFHQKSQQSLSKQVPQKQPKIEKSPVSKVSEEKFQSSLQIPNQNSQKGLKKQKTPAKISAKTNGQPEIQAITHHQLPKKQLLQNNYRAKLTKTSFDETQQEVFVDLRNFQTENGRSKQFFTSSEQESGRQDNTKLSSNQQRKIPKKNNNYQIQDSFQQIEPEPFVINLKLEDILKQNVHQKNN